MENCATASGESGDPNILFDQFVNAGTCKSILHTFQLLCDSLDIKQTDHRHFYRRLKLKLTSWKAQSLWAKLDKRANHKEYKKGEACPNTKVSCFCFFYISIYQMLPFCFDIAKQLFNNWLLFRVWMVNSDYINLLKYLNI